MFFVVVRILDSKFVQYLPLFLLYDIEYLFEFFIRFLNDFLQCAPCCFDCSIGCG